MPKRQPEPVRRVNLALTDENYGKLKLICEAYEISLTALINHIVKLYRQDHPDIIQNAEVRKKIQSSGLLPEKKKEPDT